MKAAYGEVSFLDDDREYYHDYSIEIDEIKTKLKSIAPWLIDQPAVDFFENNSNTMRLIAVNRKSSDGTNYPELYVTHKETNFDAWVQEKTWEILLNSSPAGCYDILEE